MEKFKLNELFLKPYATKKVDWGFNGLGYFIFKKTYARNVYDLSGQVERTEEWHETVKRCVEGVYTYQKKHCKNLGLPWDNSKAQKSAQTMYNKIFNFKFTPPGRGMWMCGTLHVLKHGSAAMNNCAFVSTLNIDLKNTLPFEWVFNYLMLGVGCLEPSTLILTLNGLVKISEVHIGDKVMSFNLNTMLFELKEVLNVIESNTEDAEKLLICLLNGLIIKCTSNHLFLTDKCWVEAKSLSTSDKLINYSSNIKYVCDLLPDNLKYYDLTVKDNHNFVLANGAIAHNCASDVLGAGKIVIKEPQLLNPWTKEVPIFKIPDTRLGWVLALKWKLKAYFDGKPMPEYDYSLIRPAGLPIKGFGGTSSGPEPLKALLEAVDNIFKPMIGKKISATNIVDVMNNIAKAVVAGNVRRSALLFLGDILSEEYINLKNPDMHKELLMSHRWASNNSVYAYVGKTDYSKIIPNIIKNGLPGLVWIDNCRNYSRMNNGPDYSDLKVKGVNPCVTGDTQIFTQLFGLVRMDYLVHMYNSGHSINVLSRNLKTNKNLYKPVLFAAMTRKNANVVSLVLQNNIGINLTNDHKVWCTNRNLYVIALRLSCEDYVLLSDGRQMKVSAVMQFGSYDVYDITVELNHNFFGNSILVHNCALVTLLSYLLCNLVLLYPSKHDTLELFLLTIKYAYLYAKSITLVNTLSALTNAVMLKNRRIGVSMTGVIDSFVKFGRRNFLLNWCKQGYDVIKRYDKVYSDWLCIPKSIKTTVLKPAGTTSLLAGVSSGVHYPHSKYYIRRVRLNKDSEFVDLLIKAGYNVLPDVYNPQNTCVVEFPVQTLNFVKGKRLTTLFLQLMNAADMQRYWADNSVSVTVTFKKDELCQLQTALLIFEDKLKTVSFLPEDVSHYLQLPYELITKLKYELLKNNITGDLNLIAINSAGVGLQYCTTDSCLIKAFQKK